MRTKAPYLLTFLATVRVQARKQATMSGKRCLEKLVETTQDRITKMQKIATEANVLVQQLQGDLYMAKAQLKEVEDGGDAATKNESVKKEEDAMSEGEFEQELRIEKEIEAKAAAEAADSGEGPPMPSEEVLAAWEAGMEAGGTLSGYPDDGTTPENATFEALLKAGTLRLKLVERPGHAPDQAVEPGPKGRKSDVFEHKDLFKQCNPRFFFNGDAKEWRRTAPEGWTGMPPVMAAA